MTAAEWRACGDPKPMLRFVRRKASDRKLRLLACACWRAMPGLMSNEECSRAVGLLESCAEGAVAPAALARAAKLNGEELVGLLGDPAASARRLAAGLICDPDALSPAKFATVYRGADPQLQAAFLRCVLGDPFRPVAFPASWRTDTAVALAAGMYEGRDFGAMPILADALQDAGCDDDAVLAHCREANGVHVRGCWVVDGVLGRT